MHLIAHPDLPLVNLAVVTVKGVCTCNTFSLDWTCRPSHQSIGVKLWNSFSFVSKFHGFLHRLSLLKDTSINWNPHSSRMCHHLHIYHTSWLSQTEEENYWPFWTANTDFSIPDIISDVETFSSLGDLSVCHFKNYYRSTKVSLAHVRCICSDSPGGLKYLSVKCPAKCSINYHGGSKIIKLCKGQPRKPQFAWMTSIRLITGDWWKRTKRWWFCTNKWTQTLEDLHSGPAEITDSSFSFELLPGKGQKFPHYD